MVLPLHKLKVEGDSGHPCSTPQLITSTLRGMLNLPVSHLRFCSPDRHFVWFYRGVVGSVYLPIVPNSAPLYAIKCRPETDENTTDLWVRCTRYVGN